MGEDAHRTPRAKSGTKNTWFEMMKGAESVELERKMNQGKDDETRTKADTAYGAHEPRPEGDMEMETDTNGGTATGDQRGDEHVDNQGIYLNVLPREHSMIIHQTHHHRPPFSRPILNIPLQTRWPHDPPPKRHQPCISHTTLQRHGHPTTKPSRLPQNYPTPRHTRPTTYTPTIHR